MRKIMNNKKGFSLVELMIVVVVMGILVAVAVPLYDAVTDNAKAKTCGSNQRIIRGAISNWILSDSNHTVDTLFKTSEKQFNGKTQNPEDVFEESFLEQFENGEFPECSVEDHYFVVEKIDSLTIQIKCYDADGNEAEKHNERANG